MKKIITLLFAVGSITFASAQSLGHKNSSFKDDSDPYHHSNVDRGRRASNDVYSFSLKEKEIQIEKINREFNYKISAVKKSRYLRAHEKSKQIRALESQRNMEIKQVQMRFEKGNRRDSDIGFGKNNSQRW